jgi:hypothetical protein
MKQRSLTRLHPICLALPEAEERETWGEPTFRVREKIFCMHRTDTGAPALWCKAPLVPRTGSSHHNCRESDCELRVQSGTNLES